MTNETQEQIIQYCGFKIGEGHYAVPVLSVQEVLKPQIITPIPRAQEYIRGLINLRGQIVTSISVRKLFELEEDLAAPHMNIIVKSTDSLISLVVDEILDVIDVEKSLMTAPPETLSRQIRKYLSSVYKAEDNLTLLIDLEKIYNAL